MVELMFINKGFPAQQALKASLNSSQVGEVMMRKRSYGLIGTLIVYVVGQISCINSPSAEKIKESLDEGGYVVLTKAQHAEITSQTIFDNRVQGSLAAYITSFTQTKDPQKGAASLSFYQRLETSRRKAEIAALEAKEFQRQTNTQYSELESKTLDPILHYGESIKGLRTRLGEFQIDLEVQAQMMSDIWNRYESFCKYTKSQGRALKQGLDNNYQQTRIIMNDTNTPLTDRIENWIEQSDKRAELRAQFTEEIYTRCQEDIESSSKDVDALILEIRTSSNDGRRPTETQRARPLQTQTQ